MIWDLNVNGEEVEGAGKNNHVLDVCADRYKISMHTVSLTSAPEGLFESNLIAAFFFPPNICRRRIKQKVELASVEEFSSQCLWWDC